MDTLYKGLATQPVRVLIVEDRPEDAELMLHALRRSGLDPDWSRADTEEGFLAALEGQPDIVLADYLMPEFGGMHALELLKDRAPDIPLIIVSGSIGEDIAVEAMRCGAADYLLKDRLARLGAAVRSALELKRARDTQRRVQSEIQRLAAIVESSQDAIISRGLDRRIVSWNPAAERLFGWSAAEAVGRSISIIIPPERENESLRNRELLHRGHAVPSYDTERLTKDGRRIHVSLTQSPVKNEHGEVIAVSVMLRDITERKLSERRRAMEHTIIRVLAESPSLDVAMPRLIRSVCEAMEWAYGARWMWDERKRNLVRLEYWSEFDPNFDPSDRHYWLQLGKSGSGGLLRRAWLDKKPTWLADINREATFLRKPSCAKFGLHSAYSFPILADATAIGVMEFFGRDVRDPDEILLQTTLAIGRQIGQFIQRKEAEEKIKRLNRVYAVLSGINALIVRVRDRQELLNEACSIGVEHGGFGVAWVGMCDPRTLDVTPVAWAGIAADDILAIQKSTARADVPQGQGAIGRAVRERRPVFFNDVAAAPGEAGERRKELIRRGYRSVIALPLIVDGAPLGILGLYTREPNFFNDEELVLLTELAGNISFALESMAKQQKLDKLSRIRAVSSAINFAIVRIRDREALLQETCRIAAERGKFELVWVASLDSAKQEIRPVAWAGFSAEAAQGVTWASINAVQGTFDEAIRTRRPSVRDDVGVQLSAGRLRQEAVAKGFHSMACLPLVVDDNVVGLIALYGQGVGFFDEDELDLLDEVAGDVSLALQSIEKREKVEFLSYYDALTGLPNRSLFIDRLSQQMRARSGESAMVALALFDLDRFRAINETLGHHGGDELLKLVARRLEQTLRGRDYLGRTGGDEFGVVMRGIGDAASVAHAVESEILACFREPFDVCGRELRVTAKTGVALFPTDGDEADTLFKNAEAALKKAKASSERYLFYAAEMNARAAQVLSLETRLRQAVEAEQFVLHYQPKVELATGRLSGLEGLIRWNDPETGLVPPGTFIPLLEETGMILETGRWAVRQALDDRRDWYARGLQPPRIAVNVSPVQLRRKDFVDEVRNGIREFTAAHHGLDLEITESLVMEDIEGNIAKLRLLRDMGINIVIDDFGTGYSSLGYLAKLPVNALKIDRLFIANMAINPDSMTIVSTIISLAHSLSLKVIAEGVETEEQSKFLKLLKCDEIQGYLISKPLPAKEVEPLLQP